MDDFLQRDFSRALSRFSKHDRVHPKARESSRSGVASGLGAVDPVRMNWPRWLRGCCCCDNGRLPGRPGQRG